jgi:release factor glutamine methyltransferase
MSELEAVADAGEQRLDDVVRRAVRALENAGVETPRIDAQRLVQAATGLGVADLISRPQQMIGDWERLAPLIRRRCAHEPVSRILGEREFYGRPFLISPATLDPRPDSETLIEEALALADELGWRTRPLRILDIGTGSGALLVTLLAELPLSSGLGTDVSPRALKVAAANAQRHAVLERARFELRDALHGVAGPFDLVVCNPPYVATGEIAGLAPEVREHDPIGALDGGADGLDVYRKIIPALASVVGSGWVVFEVGAGQSTTVAQLLRDRVPSGTVRIRKDLGGHDRSVAMEIQL